MAEPTIGSEPKRHVIGNAAFPSAGRSRGALIADRYRVLETLGEGGMGRVYRVYDESTSAELALKEHKHSTNEDADQARRVRFRREFHTIARLRHPLIVRAYDYGFDRDCPHYTMELLRPLRAADFRGRLRPACRAIRDLAAALSFLHNRRLVHRDVALNNVGFSEDGSAKLLDFGMVAVPGTTGEIAGTLPYIAPEIFRGVPLDARSDVYGLGVLAFLLLTGKQPKAATEAEHRPPVPPSSLVADIPSAIDELLLAMLSPHPLARPLPTEVADTLTEAVALEPLAATTMSVGHFASPPLVGREREMDTMRLLLQRCLEGTGGAAVVEGESGTGKSRVLTELAVEAQVAGAIVIRAHADIPGQPPYGVVRELAKALFAAAPQQAADAARVHASALGDVVPELGADAVPNSTSRADQMTNEERVRIQSHLCGWFLDIFRVRPTVVLVDDLQRCDEPSAAVLAALADAAANEPLTLVAGLRTDEAIRAPANIARILSAAVSIRLGSLEPSDVDQLLRGIFGDTPNVERMASWLHRLAGSRPMHCIGLVRDLVDRSVIRYTDGFWVIPRDLSQERLPDEFADAIEDWLSSLSQTARRLGQAMAVYGRAADIPQLLELSGTDEPEMFAAIDELTYSGVLVGSEQSLGFCHDSYREGLLAGTGTDELRRLHLRAARVLELEETGSDDGEEIGWHLLRGGKVQRGAELLEQAGRLHFDRHAFADAIPPLVAALEVFRGHDPDSPRCRELECLLMKAGAIADRAIAMEYADTTLATMGEYSGVALANRLRRWIGAPLGMLVGAGCAWLKWRLRPRRNRGPGPFEAGHRLSTAIVIRGTTCLTAIDESRLEELVSISAPFRVFRNRVPSICHLFVCAFLAYCRAERDVARAGCEEILSILKSDHSTPLSEADRRVLEGAARLVPALASAHAQDGSEHEALAELRAVSLPFFDLAAQQIEVLYHRVRGEESLAVVCESKAELMSIQLGSVWQTETMSPVSGSLAYARTHDIRGLRRCIEELERLVARGDRLETHLLLTEASYYRLRGRHQIARKRLETVIANLGDRRSWLRSIARNELALVELRSGNLEEAKAIALEEGSFAREGHGPFIMASVAVVAGLADAHLGDPEAGVKRITQMLRRIEHSEYPPEHFQLHSAAAEIAQLTDDVGALTRHVAEMDRIAAPTQNPALLARVERWDGILAAHRAAHAELQSEAADGITAVDGFRDEDDFSLVHRLERRLATCVGDEQRAEELLKTLVLSCVADRGYLFMVHEGRPEILASTTQDSPPSPEMLGLDLGTDWQAIPLWRRRGGTRELAGLAALIGQDARPAPAWLANDLMQVMDRAATARGAGA